VKISIYFDSILCAIIAKNPVKAQFNFELTDQEIAWIEAGYHHFEAVQSFLHAHTKAHGTLDAKILAKLLRFMLLGNIVHVHDCSICGYPCGFIIENNQLVYDHGCLCTGNRARFKRIHIEGFKKFLIVNYEAMVKLAEGIPE
jgi:hypothetical protein